MCELSKLSKIGLGTVKFGRNQAVKYPQSFSIPDDQEIIKLLNLCLELGINTLDTAPAYGESEIRLGKLLKLLKPKREDWILISKSGEEFINGKSIYDFSAKAVEASIYRSLKKLNTDYLDILLIHSDGNDLEILNDNSLLELLDKLKSQGIILSHGISSKTIEGGLLGLKLLDYVMVSYNIWDQTNQDILNLAAKLNKKVLIKKALNSGYLANSANLKNPQLEIKNNLKFILKNPAVASIILGTLNSQHLRENYLAASE